MNKHPNKKRSWCRAVVGYNLTTGERHEWPSVKTAAEGCGMQASWFTVLLKQKRTTNGWLCAYADDEKSILGKLEYHMRSGKYAVNTNAKGKGLKGKVALRIDSRTVIYVTPDKATPEYADEYRKWLDKNR